jgi:hypothetical protein
MGSTWESLLETFIEVRDRQYRSDPDRDAARLDNLEFIMQRILEKLRDQEEK